MEIYKWPNLHSLTFYIGLFSKFVGVGLNLALLKDNKPGDPRFVLFFSSKMSNDSP